VLSRALLFSKSCVTSCDAASFAIVKRRSLSQCNDSPPL